MFRKYYIHLLCYMALMVLLLFSLLPYADCLLTTYSDGLFTYSYTDSKFTRNKHKVSSTSAMLKKKTVSDSKVPVWPSAIFYLDVHVSSWKFVSIIKIKMWSSALSDTRILSPQTQSQSPKQWKNALLVILGNWDYRLINKDSWICGFMFPQKLIISILLFLYFFFGGEQIRSACMKFAPTPTYPNASAKFICKLHLRNLSTVVNFNKMWKTFKWKSSEWLFLVLQENKYL